ncbi:MAG TPA: PQQ-binding-like beta-propeller repeat protein [Bryobacteraceae bacterium]|nr:PQQ-binding-like beta-propeller repeat protein [Bryobacteraceae bacterium]
MLRQRDFRALVLTSFLPALATIAVAQVQQPNTTPEGNTELGFRTFQTKCMTCHGSPNVDRAPSPAAIREMSPERIYEALTTGVMKEQGASLTDDEKRKLALFMSGRPLGTLQSGDAKNMPNRCAANPPLKSPAAGPAWNGWGVDVANTRFQDLKAAGIRAADVPKLKLKWAFGYPGGISAFGQPTVASGRVFVGTDTGYIYSLDAKTGCVYWSYRTKGSVRNAITIGPVRSPTSKYAIYFGDAHANVYGVDAQTGAELWVQKVDQHFAARITAAPTLYGGRLYVPVSSSEEFSAASVDYPCCTSRGSVVSLDANTGARVWKTYVTEEPKPTRKNSNGVQLYAPAGGSVWNSPTVDPKRQAIYFGTGDSETEPAAPTSDSIMAVDMSTGKVRWVYQAQEGDAYLSMCAQQKTENCPENVGPDLDIGNSPVLRTFSNGKSILVAGTKDGNVFALDPDRKGAVVWKVVAAQNAPGTPLARLNGILWGGASDPHNIYYGLSGGGVVALQLATGEKLWHTEFDTGGRRISNAAAASGMPGVVFVGGGDGRLRALSTADGKQIWEFETARTFETVNKVQAKGGTIGAPGATIAGGMVFAGSGYSTVGGLPGNVLLAFGLD